LRLTSKLSQFFAVFRHFFSAFDPLSRYSGVLHQEANMKGDDQVIQHLNETLKNELTAINQYWLHYRMLDNWGVTRLAQYERHESIDEMKHADSLADRILFLEGLPNFQMLGRLRIGETVEEILKADLDLEREAVDQLKGAIAHAETVRDYVSRELFENILESEESHIDFLETQFEMIERMGLQNYVQMQSKPAEG
jgi:bacterioferritin